MSGFNVDAYNSAKAKMLRRDGYRQLDKGEFLLESEPDHFFHTHDGFKDGMIHYHDAYGFDEHHPGEHKDNEQETEEG